MWNLLPYPTLPQPAAKANDPTSNVKFLDGKQAGLMNLLKVTFLFNLQNKCKIQYSVPRNVIMM
jgi:hypothetical protein